MAAWSILLTGIAATAGEPAPPALSTAELIRTAPAASAFPQASAVWLLDESSRQLHAGKSLKQTRTGRKVIKVFNAAGIKRHGQQTIVYDHRAETVEILRADVYAGGKKMPVPADAITEIDSSSKNVFVSRRTKIVSMAGLEPGATLEICYRVTREIPKVAGKFSVSHVFESVDPLLISRLIVDMPEATGFKHAVAGEGVKYTSRDKGGRTIHQWERRNTPAMHREPYAVNEPTYVVVSNWNSWTKLGDWFADLSQPSLEESAAVKKFAIDATANRDDKVKALYYAVANQIRYVSISIGAGSHRPHLPAETLERRFGDCKDKAALLVNALSEIGVKSHFALINNMKADFPLDTPDLARFNHAIVAVPRKDGKMLWLDPTSATCPFGELPAGDQGQHALVVIQGKSKLLKTPASQPDDNARRITIDCELTPEGEVKGTVEMVFTGIVAQIFRGALKSRSAGQRIAGLKQMAAVAAGGAVRFSEESVSGVEMGEGPLRFRARFQSDEYASGSGDQIALTPPGVHLYDAMLLQLTAAEDRHTAVNMGAAMAVQSKVSIKLPGGYTVANMPADNCSQGKSVRYCSRYSQTGGVLLVEYEFAAIAPHIPIAEYPLLKKIVKAKRAAQRKQLLVTKKK